MIKLTRIPLFVKVLFEGMPVMWKSRHMLIFCWLVLLHAVFPGKKTLNMLSTFSTSSVTAWRFRRLLKAGYRSIHFLISWFAEQAAAKFPPPENGVLCLIGDGSEKDKRGRDNPVVQKGRKSKNKPWFFGIRFVILMAAWDVFRIPVALRIILPKTHPDYENENALFREMVTSFSPPEWAETVIVMGDCAYASKDNMKMVMQRDKSDPERCWKFVFAIARTWKTEDGRFVKNLVRHLPSKFYTRTWIPKLPAGKGRKTFWVFSKTVRLRHIGEVTLVLSKKGPNTSPGRTRLIVTNLTGLTARQILCIYNRRRSIEILFKELKSGLGLGEHQITKNKDRVEKSFGIAVIAYLLVIRSCSEDIRHGRSWSIFQLQSNFRMKIITNQIEHNMELKLEKIRKAA